MLIYAMKLLFKDVMKLLMKLLIWGKGAFNILI